MLANPRVQPRRRTESPSLLLVVDHVQFSDGYDVKNGRPTSEALLVRLSMATLMKLYQDDKAADFGPPKLKGVRQKFVESGLCWAEVNKRVGRVIHAFRWAAENELIPAGVTSDLINVPRIGTCARLGAKFATQIRPLKKRFRHINLRSHPADPKKCKNSRLTIWDGPRSDRYFCVICFCHCL